MTAINNAVYDLLSMVFGNNGLNAVFLGIIYAVACVASAWKFRINQQKAFWFAVASWFVLCGLGILALSAMELQRLT